MAIFNILFGWIGRYYYEKKFYKNLETYEKFLYFIHYYDIINGINFKNDYGDCKSKHNIENGICYYSTDNCKGLRCFRPCQYNPNYKKIFEKIPINELRKFYDLKKSMKFKKDVKKTMNIATYKRTSEYFNPSWYYGFNCNYFFRELYTYVSKTYFQIISEEEKLKQQKLKEQKVKEALTTVVIINAFKSKNPYQNNSLSIGVEYQIKKTKEKFIDYITNSTSSEVLQYKTARLQIATDTVDIEKIFDENFETWRNKVIGKEIIVDTKIKDKKRKIDLFIGGIFYKKK